MASHESLIADALNLDRGRMNRYCRTVDPRFLEQVNRKKPSTMAQLADIWYTSHGANYGFPSSSPSVPEGCVPCKPLCEDVPCGLEFVPDEAEPEEPGPHGVFRILILLRLRACRFHFLRQARIIGPSVIEGYRLLFKGSRTGSYLTIEPQEGASVPVAAWAVTEEDEAALDRYEGFPSFYYKKEMELPLKGIKTGKVRLRKVFVYIMHEDRPLGLPSEFSRPRRCSPAPPWCRSPGRAAFCRPPAKLPASRGRSARTLGRPKSSQYYLFLSFQFLLCCRFPDAKRLLLAAEHPPCGCAVTAAPHRRGREGAGTDPCSHPQVLRQGMNIAKIKEGA